VKEENQAPQATEEAPPVKRKLKLVVALAATAALLFASLVAAAFLYHGQATRLQAQLAQVMTELNAKNLALTEAKAEAAALARELQAIKDQAEMHSGEGGERLAEAPPVAVADASPAAAASPAADDAPAAAAPAKKAKAKPQGESCDMVGKSPAEQAATLRRCVTLMDKPPASAKR
jgi:hypothetical protein